MPDFKTARGLIVTAESPEAAAAIDNFEVGLLGLSPQLELIFQHADAFPETPLVQAYAATALLYAQAATEAEQAGQRLAQARRCLYGASDREIQYVEAIEHFQRGEFSSALTKLETLTQAHPNDLVAAKVAEFLYYCLGQHHSGERFLWHMMRLREANGEHPGFLSMLSFAYELCGRYDEARAAAENSLRQEPGQPWSHHTLAHVLIRTGKVEEGRREMERFAPHWKNCVRGIHAHNAWHQSLFSVEQADWQSADEILRRDIWGQAPDYVGEQLDATALLWRLDLAGQPNEHALADVARHCAARAGDCFTPFVEGHFAYALARAGNQDAVEQSVGRARERAARHDLEGREIWRPVGASFVEACASCGAGDAKRAVKLLEPIAERLPMVGGSDAQDDLFRLAYFNALAESGRKAEARAYYDGIVPAKTAHTPFDELMLAKCN